MWLFGFDLLLATILLCSLLLSLFLFFLRLFLLLVFLPLELLCFLRRIVYDLLIEQAVRGLQGSLETKAAFQLSGLIPPSPAPFR